MVSQSYSHHTRIVLVQNQKYRPMELDRKPRQTHGPLNTLSLTKEARIQRRKDSPSNKWCWENWSAMCKRMKLAYFLTQYTKINSKWISDLNVRPETIKFLEENVGRTFDDINQSKILYGSPPRIMEIKTKVNK